jgi:hypothetical protein
MLRVEGAKPVYDRFVTLLIARCNRSHVRARDLRGLNGDPTWNRDQKPRRFADFPRSAMASCILARA